MSISLKAMEYFTTVVRHGNISKAAAELNIAASAVSTAIDQIEATFELELFTRQRSRGVQANASGLAAARKFEKLLDDYRSVLAEGADLKQALSGSLRIGYYAPIAPAFLPEILTSFVPASSDVTLHLEECDNESAQDGLLNGTYDVILFVSKDVRPAISFDVLVEAPAYCLLPATHTLANQTSISLHEISKEPLVVLNRPVASSYYRSLFDSQHCDISIAAYANSTEMVRSLVGAGFGLAVLNMCPLTTTTYSGTSVIGLPISDPLPPLPLAVAYNKSRPRRLVQHFLAACKDHFAATGSQRCIVDL
ncbi:LysR family transcriptional regulator [Pelagimonas varians]|uniref:HTH-type transcriptional activator CmpR n=1 Tax=Pelagimonas varians TaxID=696760 RepID=A0A238KT01_9RHOB|nr:LysR family transcriptional regulator [Pelagimonas varians]PYG32562.1 DNA-binding transcriptional LysR family regulator [Pelagimonas varians]SMX45953.1 HTH-type transcriptional activator CmpR [Pelagimonas varians]